MFQRNSGSPASRSRQGPEAAPAANPETIVCSYLEIQTHRELDLARRSRAHWGYWDTMAVFKFTVLMMLPNPAGFAGLKVACG